MITKLATSCPGSGGPIFLPWSEARAPRLTCCRVVIVGRCPSPPATVAGPREGPGMGPRPLPACPPNSHVAACRLSCRLSLVACRPCFPWSRLSGMAPDSSLKATSDKRQAPEEPPSGRRPIGAPAGATPGTWRLPGSHLGLPKRNASGGLGIAVSPPRRRGGGTMSK